MGKWVEIFLWYSCHLKCSFCFQKNLREQQPLFLNKEVVEDIIIKWAEKGGDFLVFSWWEATLDKNLLSYIELGKKNFYSDIRVHTNWLMFSSKNILDQYIQAGMTGVVISIHWYGMVHDKLVGLTGAFDKVRKTLLNLYEIKKENPKFVIDTNTALAPLNKNNLFTLFKFLSYFPITRCQIVQLYSLYLFSYKEKQSLYVTYKDFESELWKILNLSSIHVTLENFPFCKVEEKYWPHIEKRQKYNNNAYGNMWEWLEESSTELLEGCQKCIKKDICTWVPRDYIEIYSEETFNCIT